MRRRDTHPSILLTWALANAEACLSGSPQIDPIHFFSALLQILDDAYHQTAERIGLSSEEMRELGALAAEGREIVGISQEQITRLRRAIQKTRSPNTAQEPSQTLHRSAQARGAFDLAGG